MLICNKSNVKMVLLPGFLFMTPCAVNLSPSSFSLSWFDARLADSQAHREPFTAGCRFNRTHRLNMATGRTR